MYDLFGNSFRNPKANHRLDVKKNVLIMGKKTTNLPQLVGRISYPKLLGSLPSTNSCERIDDEAIATPKFGGD